jgi:NAD-dependent dihydropyrimidine dehydrogenase PreA subunit
VAETKKWAEGDCFVEIDLALCKGDSKCADDCPADVYSVTDGKVIAENIGDCVACGACQGVCPNNAILSHSAWT